MSKEDLAGMLYDSLQKKIKTLPDDVIVYPAHGPGSACGKSIGKETFSTIGEQKKFNYALKDQTRSEFITELTTGILPPPQYFFEDARINKEGYSPIEEVISDNSKPLTETEVKAWITKGAVVLDTRKADEFENGFIPDAVNIGLNGQFAVWVGTLLKIEQPLVLITEPGKENEAVLRLARIGYENVKGYLAGGIKSWTGKTEVHDQTFNNDNPRRNTVGLTAGMDFYARAKYKSEVKCKYRSQRPPEVHPNLPG